MRVRGTGGVVPPTPAFPTSHLRPKPNQARSTVSSIPKAVQALLAFRDARDWQQFHNPKDLAAALSIEAAELLEVFLWKEPEEADVDQVKEELADVFSYALLLANHYDLDISELVLDKLRTNETRYPVEKAKGRATKHDQL
ncbi:MAG: nucleotide pyrophosphohydrolase [Gemmatimonadales bacterium]|nr:MAG: nucleotide pyrophosphohydrolase [Gemmatimonadales bacterium]